MNTRLMSFARAALAVALLCLALDPALAQTAQAQAQKELARAVPAGSVQACSLITRADVNKATGRDPYVDPESAGQGGWICNVGTAELKVYSGPNSWDAWESTLKGFKKDKEPKTPAPELWRACVLPLPEAGERVSVECRVPGCGVGQSHARAVARRARGQAGQSMRPALESLMKTILARLP